MNKQKIISWALINSVGTAAYIVLITFFLSNAEKLFGKKDNDFLIPIAMLLLFVISAAITGSLVLGRPTYMIYEGQKKEGAKMFFYTIVFLALIMATVFGIMILIK